MSTDIQKRQILVAQGYSHSIDARLYIWKKENVLTRFWQKDGTIWVSDPTEAAQTSSLTDRLGWLTIAEEMRSKVDELVAFANEVKDAGFTEVVLLGMGGSSLTPEVFMKTFGNADGYPALTVLDSTHPASVKRVADSLDYKTTIFIVSSKSGGTVETLSFYKYFFSEVSKISNTPGDHFVAITDPNSKLEATAKDKGFRRIFSSPHDIGGRYSTFTYFGLVPAALIGLDIATLLDRTIGMINDVKDDIPYNSPLNLGVMMGELALAGRDKITFFMSPQIDAFGAWVEQLIAESTGKKEKGIVPIVDENLTASAHYGDDRFFVYIRLEGDENSELDNGFQTLEEAGFPIVKINLNDRFDLGREFFRWGLATAAAGAVLEINPFDQPNVELAKIKARELMAKYKETGELPIVEPNLREGNIEIYTTIENVKTLDDVLATIKPNDYLCLMAYIPQTKDSDEFLSVLRHVLRNKFRVATSVGYGPRFLHSTGQLHKGDGNKGVFIQLTHAPTINVPIPDEGYTFGTLLLAQAQGDYQALADRSRRIVRLHFTGESVNLLDVLKGATSI